MKFGDSSIGEAENQLKPHEPKKKTKFEYLEVVSSIATWCGS